MKNFIFIIAFGIFSFLSCESPEEEDIGYGAIRGFTNIESTGEPVPGLEAKLSNGESRITDASGTFLFESVVEGDYVLEIYQALKLLRSKEVHITANNLLPVFFTFEYVQKSLPDLTAVDISAERVDWDYKVVGKEEYFYIDEENSKPKFVLYYSFRTDKTYGITFNADGLPAKVQTDGFIFLLDNFIENKCDLAILSPSGEIQIAREIQTEFVWPTSFPITKSIQSKADFIRWTCRILGAIPCVTSGVSAFITGGAAIPLALWTCGNYFLGIGADFFNDADVENGFTEFVKDYSLSSTAYTCTTDPSSCLVSLARKGLNAYADYIEELEAKEDDIRVAEASLYAGYGDIQITLTWDNESDLDLQVIDPFGEVIYWQNKKSQSQGVLDYDNITGYGPENVYWPKDRAPFGLYQIYVHHYPWTNKPDSSNYTVLINAFGKTKKISGPIDFDQAIHIADFDNSGIFDNPLKKSNPANFKIIKAQKIN